MTRGPASEPRAPENGPSVLRLLVDTSVWLDLARSRDGQALIVPIRVLKHCQRLEVPVPQIVIDEFERNRPNAEARVAQQSVASYGATCMSTPTRNRLDEWLDEMTHQVPMISAMTLQNFREISELLAAGRRLDPTVADHDQVIRRALNKRAPFHLPKNSVADALLIELYRSALDQFDPDERLCFAKANYEDFSRGRATAAIRPVRRRSLPLRPRGGRAARHPRR